MIQRTTDAFDGTNERFVTSGKTMIGGRSENQDSLGCVMEPEKGFFVTVCDGMGGHAGGATASTNAVKAILAYLSEPIPLETPLEQIISAVRTANNVIYQQAKETPELRGMGSTTTVVKFCDDAAYIAYVGDSRIYQLRKGTKVFRTFDHSKVMEDFVLTGRITEEQARVHPQNNIIKRALGIRPEVELEAYRLSYKKGDRFVLCCDGVWNSMPEPDLIRMMSQSKPPKEIVEELSSTVNQIGMKNGGQHDNLTVVIVDINKDSTYQPTIFSKIKSLLFKKKRKPSL